MYPFSSGMVSLSRTESALWVLRNRFLGVGGFVEVRSSFRSFGLGLRCLGRTFGVAVPFFDCFWGFGAWRKPMRDWRFLIWIWPESSLRGFRAAKRCLRAVLVSSSLLDSSQKMIF